MSLEGEEDLKSLNESVWSRIGGQLDAVFERVVRQAKQAYPSLHASAGWSEYRGGTRLLVRATFVYEPESSEFEDLLLTFMCVPVERCFWGPGGSPLFPGLNDREVVKFEIERGVGLMLAALDPALLPGRQGSPEYETAALAYAEQARILVEAHTDVILDALGQPYQR